MEMDRTNEIMVHVRESHQYGTYPVHDSIEFDVRVNEFLCVCGPSGCGKTTLLDILSGLIKPTEGAVLVHGQPVNPKKQNISFVFQEPSTLPWLTVRDNIAVGLRVKNPSKTRCAPWWTALSTSSACANSSVIIPIRSQAA